MQMTLRDRFALEFAKAYVTKWPTASDNEIVEKAVSLADCLALRLALGDPVEQALAAAEARKKGMAA